MTCRNCGKVFDVFYEGENIWYVEMPGQPPPQTQFSVAGALCLDAECVISDTRGLLSDEPISVDLG